jgi:hypothetical protein
MRPSAFLYGLTLCWTSTAYNLILWHAVRADAFEADIPKTVIASTVRAYRTGWIVYTSAALLALFFPLVAFAAYLGIAIYYLIPRGVDSDVDDQRRNTEVAR